KGRFRSFGKSALPLQRANVFFDICIVSSEAPADRDIARCCAVPDEIGELFLGWCQVRLDCCGVSLRERIRLLNGLQIRPASPDTGKDALARFAKRYARLSRALSSPLDVLGRRLQEPSTAATERLLRLFSL